MLIPDDPWRSAPRYSEQRFVQRLAGANPELLAERPPGEYYGKILTYGVDPALIVEQLWKESSGGNAGVARHTKSWGNTGYPVFGPAPLPSEHDQIGLDDKRFPAYASWLDGLEATLARYVAPNWVYSKRHAIAEIFEHPSGDVWAPAKHYNDPTGYLNFLVTRVNAHMDLPGTQTLPGPVSIRAWIVPKTRPTIRSGIKLDAVRYLTVHETDNRDEGADATMHAKLLATNPNWTWASWHVQVDDDEAIQSIPWDEVAFHAGDGDGPGNRTSLSIEQCVNDDGNWWATRRLSASVCVYLLANHDLGLDRMVQHNHWLLSEQYWATQGKHKNCPQRTRGRGEWDSFVELVGRGLRGQTPIVEGPRFFDLNDQNQGHYVGGGFQRFWEETRGAYYIFGPALSEEFTDNDGVTRQVFQKAIFEHRPDLPAWNSWHVYTMNLAQMDVVAALAGYQTRHPAAFAYREGPTR